MLLIFYYMPFFIRSTFVSNARLKLAKNQANVKMFTKINTPPLVFFTFLKLYKWYQIAQCITYGDKMITISSIRYKNEQSDCNYIYMIMTVLHNVKMTKWLQKFLTEVMIIIMIIVIAMIIPTYDTMSFCEYHSIFCSSMLSFCKYHSIFCSSLLSFWFDGLTGIAPAKIIFQLIFRIDFVSVFLVISELCKM